MLFANPFVTMQRRLWNGSVVVESMWVALRPLGFVKGVLLNLCTRLRSWLGLGCVSLSFMA